MLLVLCASSALAGEFRCTRGEPATLLVVGDSLSAAYGIDLNEGWVALLQARLDEQGYEYRVVNASISGDTTAGGLTRLREALPKHRPALVVIELGANDGLRALPLRTMRRNLAEMIEASRNAGARVALLGIHIPSNYGARYTKAFHAIYPELAEKYDVPLVDFFLDGVALDRSLLLADGLHPNAKAQPRLLDNAWAAIAPQLVRPCGD